MGWKHNADLVEVITKLNDALRLEKESHAAAQQKEALAWNHSADLVAHGASLVEELKKAAEDKAELQGQVQAQAGVIDNTTQRLAASTREANELSMQLDAMTKDVTALQAELTHQTEERTALPAAKDKLLEDKEKSGTL